MLKFIKKIVSPILVISFLTTSFIASPASADVEKELTSKAKPNSSFSTLVDNIVQGKTELRINTLKETNVTKDEALKQYAKAFDIVEKYIAEKNIKINQDLDNIEYQRFIKSLGVSLDDFSESDRQEIVKLVKFVDLYENAEKNKIINNLKSKLYAKSINEKDLAELLELVPVSLSEASTVEAPTTVEASVYQEKADIKPLRYANGYSSVNARDYAYKWWDDRNPTYSKYYADYFGCSVSRACWNDCTNFVSQALYAGGMLEWDGLYLTGDDAWYFRNGSPFKPSHSWGGSNNFYNHWKYRAKLASITNDMSMGDPVNADFNNDGDIDHTAIITEFTNGRFFLTQHTIDRKDAPLSTWYSNGYKVYAWKMSTAKRSPND
ncbi:hypothetical protein ABH892_000371 [Paenibacillus sp. RC254]|uniref:amidase domain-containing protein n=1 Tax=unclassified Paenibacillus TaxID=185978 RepID=UPI0024BB86AC|nr:amidase domain-containing protein [Paenibacillus sp. RC334]